MRKRVLVEKFKPALWKNYISLNPPFRRERLEKRTEALKDYFHSKDVFVIELAVRHKVTSDTIMNWVKEYRRGILASSKK